MKSFLIKITVGLVFTLSLVAPFTFLKPPLLGGNIKPLIAEKKAKSPAKKVLKQVQEKPLHTVSLPDFGAIKDTKTKKKVFFDFIKPSIIKQNNLLRTTRVKLNTWLEQISLEIPLSALQHQELNALAQQYRVSKKASILAKLNELLLRIDIIPMPLALVQAANESAWGTSRFARIGLNFFGIWCYEKGCGMVPTHRNAGAKHEVMAFQSLDEAVAYYFYTINTHNAYRVFRSIRFELRAQDHALTAEILATGLLAYSERGADYVIDITKMLRQNAQYLTHPSSPEQALTAVD